MMYYYFDKRPPGQPDRYPGFDLAPENYLLNLACLASYIGDGKDTQNSSVGVLVTVQPGHKECFNAFTDAMQVKFPCIHRMKTKELKELLKTDGVEYSKELQLIYVDVRDIQIQAVEHQKKLVIGLLTMFRMFQECCSAGSKGAYLVIDHCVSLFDVLTHNKVDFCPIKLFMYVNSHYSGYGWWGHMVLPCARNNALKPEFLKAYDILDSVALFNAPYVTINLGFSIPIKKFTIAKSTPQSNLTDREAYRPLQDDYVLDFFGNKFNGEVVKQFLDDPATNSITAGYF